MDDNQIWYGLCGFYPEPKKKIVSPFRDDKNAGCTFNFFNGRLRFYDGADSLRNGKTAMQIYAIQNNLTFEEALQQCKEKYSEGNKVVFNDKKVVHKDTLKDTEIFPYKRKWTTEALDYWKQFNVTDMSNKYLVKSLRISKIDSVSTIDKTNTLMFCYMFDNGEFKLYEPYAQDKRYKFLGTVKPYNCWWYSEGKYDTLLTLKSSKCYECIKSIVVEYNIPVTLNHLQSESTPNYTNWKGEVTPDSKNRVAKSLPNYTKIKKYKRHLIVFDNDRQGIKAGDTYKFLMGSEVYYPPCCKDIADWLLQQSREEVVQWLFEIVGFKPS